MKGRRRRKKKDLNCHLVIMVLEVQVPCSVEKQQAAGVTRVAVPMSLWTCWEAIQRGRWHLDLGKHTTAAVKAVVTTDEKLRGRLLGRLREKRAGHCICENRCSKD